MKKNTLYVFDLDFTLWDAGGTWCDHTSPPYRRVSEGILDKQQRLIQLYPQVIHMLQSLRNRGFEMALASRTGRPDWAEKLLSLFEIDHYFSIKEIYPSSKRVHFENIRKKSGRNYTDMIFFDDEYRNIEEVSRLGVHSIHVTQGLNSSLFPEF